MRRSTKQTKVGTKVRYTVILSGQACLEPDSPEGRMEQRQLLSQLAENWELCQCGPCPFQKLRIYHSGGEWVAELEAIGDELPRG